jgi:hypothetical protein
MGERQRRWIGFRELLAILRLASLSYGVWLI